jgi:glutamate dehydrogenase/leucine dehydrogenase
MATRTPTVLRYLDPVEGHEGYLVFDGSDHPLAAGGFRIDSAFTGDKAACLAQAMSLKQAFLGLGVDGAKCGLRRDPNAPGKAEAIRRFLRFVKPHLMDRFSMGPDMGTRWEEIEGLARGEGIPSVKVAIAHAQGLSQDEFMRRLRLLDATLCGMTLGARRAGHVLAHACLATVAQLGLDDPAHARVSLQGFGTLGRATAMSLAEAGCRIVAVADEHGCVSAQDGLDAAALLRLPLGTSITAHETAKVARGPRQAILRTPADVLILAACEEAVAPEDVTDVAGAVRAVVVGANLGLSAAAEQALHDRGTVVLPDFVGGCGGPASMDAVFGPDATPTPPEVLTRIGDLVRPRVAEVLVTAERQGQTPRAAACALVERRRRPPLGHPYGQHRQDAPTEGTP